MTQLYSRGGCLGGTSFGGGFGHGISLEVFGGGIWVCAFLVVGMALGVGGLNEEGFNLGLRL